MDIKIPPLASIPATVCISGTLHSGWNMDELAFWNFLIRKLYDMFCSEFVDASRLYSSNSSVHLPFTSRVTPKYNLFTFLRNTQLRNNFKLRETVKYRGMTMNLTTQVSLSPK